MNTNQPGEITLLLQKVDGGDAAAAEDLYRLVENDLRAIAAKRRAGFDATREQSTTLLVDEAFLRLVGREVTAWLPGDRAKFFSYAATKIHNLLVEAARAKGAKKRGAGFRRQDLEALDAGQDGLESDFVIDLKGALEKLEGFAPSAAKVFRVYYFLGCTFEETAGILSVSATEAKRLCKKAQLWLQHELKAYGREKADNAPDANREGEST